MLRTAMLALVSVASGLRLPVSIKAPPAVAAAAAMTAAPLAAFADELAPVAKAYGDVVVPDGSLSAVAGLVGSIGEPIFVP